jgi:hypothetical protein
MYSVTGKDVCCQINQYKNQLEGKPSLPFSDLLPAGLVRQVLSELGIPFRKRVFDPIVTLWAFLSQVMSQDHSCREAVARVVAWRVFCGEEPCSPKTSSYCEARQRLPEELPATLARRVGREMQQQANPEWQWKGRAVKVVDGSTALAPDTPENQAAFPQDAWQNNDLRLNRVPFGLVPAER